MQVDSDAPSCFLPWIRAQWTPHCTWSIQTARLQYLHGAEIANNNFYNPTLLKRPVFLKSKAELLLLLHVTSVLNLAANLSGLTGRKSPDGAS